MKPQDYTLLVVDDNELNRDMLSRRLSRRGYQVLVAEDGQPAIDLVEHQPIDLIILDIMMPGMDGIEVLETLRATYSQAELPIIMATAKSDSEDIVRALDRGANDYVTKPIDFKVVLARIQATLRTKTSAATLSPKPAEPSPERLGEGSVIDGRYRLDEKIGAGNFGSVYRATHIQLDNEIAVKILQTNVVAGEEALARFRTEGISACRIKHPNAVAVFDFGVTETGVAYLVMELLEGRSLAEELNRSGPLSVERVVDIATAICDALEEAHEAGIVHRDIKPENVFINVTRTGEEVKVLDFGIAKLAGETLTEQNLTAEGFILGTPAYMAPERLRGNGYDGRSDVYSLGVMLYQLLVGELPFHSKTGDPMAMLMMHVERELPSILRHRPDVPLAVQSVVESSVRKDPAERPTAAELADELVIAAGRQPRAERTSPDLRPSITSSEHTDQPTILIPKEGLSLDANMPPRELGLTQGVGTRSGDRKEPSKPGLLKRLFGRLSS